ncbi:uncharacterized protein LOC129598006 [Paramacrobiotus metropolitanus]|uniref:uncharacterized protein LOC129598006 n=1 Tax=Paramacrobiotus metropolitanus TaxID=2943436 RepID=UPI00244640AD|nr:uncharacterized protein LOC129598006 [Paramacrobiotus metropolitanus]
MDDLLEELFTSLDNTVNNPQPFTDWLEELRRQVGEECTASTADVVPSARLTPDAGDPDTDYRWLDEWCQEVNEANRQELERTASTAVVVPSATLNGDAEEPDTDYRWLDEWCKEVNGANLQELVDFSTTNCDILGTYNATNDGFLAAAGSNDTEFFQQDVSVLESMHELEPMVLDEPLAGSSAQEIWPTSTEAVCYNFSTPPTITIVDQGTAPGNWVAEAVAMAFLQPPTPVWKRTNQKIATHILIPSTLRNVPWDVRAKNLLMFFGGDMDPAGWFSHAMLIFLTKRSILEISRGELQILLKYLFNGGWHKDALNSVKSSNSKEVLSHPYRRFSRTLLAWYRDFAAGMQCEKKSRTAHLTLTRISHFNSYEGCVNINLAAVESLLKQREKLAVLVPENIEVPEMI